MIYSKTHKDAISALPSIVELLKDNDLVNGQIATFDLAKEHLESLGLSCVCLLIQRNHEDYYFDNDPTAFVFELNDKNGDFVIGATSAIEDYPPFITATGDELKTEISKEILHLLECLIERDGFEITPSETELETTIATCAAAIIQKVDLFTEFANNSDLETMFKSALGFAPRTFMAKQCPSTTSYDLVDLTLSEELPPLVKPSTYDMWENLNDNAYCLDTSGLFFDEFPERRFEIYVHDKKMISYCIILSIIFLTVGFFHLIFS